MQGILEIRPAITELPAHLTDTPSSADFANTHERGEAVTSSGYLPTVRSLESTGALLARTRLRRE